MAEPLTPGKHPETIIERIIEASARNPFLVIYSLHCVWRSRAAFGLCTKHRSMPFPI